MQSIEHLPCRRRSGSGQFRSILTVWFRLFRSLAISTAVAAFIPAGLAQTYVTVFSEGFEGVFPGVAWSVGNSTTPGGPTWDDVNAAFGGEGTHAGSWKGYCAGTAYPFNSSEPTPFYTTNMAAFMSRTIDLSGYNSALLAFWHQIPGIETCCDQARIFIDTTLVWSSSSPTGNWTQVIVPLNAYLGGVHTLKFEFASDVSVNAEGWYLDDISVTAEQPDPRITVQPASQSVSVGSPVLFSVTADGSPPLNYQWRWNGTNITGSTGSTHMIFGAQPIHTGNFDVRVSNGSGVVTSLVATLTVAEVPRGAVWKYLDDGTDQGSAWREPAFDDSAWASGAAPLGFGDGDEATLIASNLQVTTYFRHTFAVSQAAHYTNLIMRLLRDDGAVVYLNGVEVLRSNLPPGEITAGTLALHAAGAPEQNTFYDTPLSPGHLRNGANVLAVEVHQSAATSSDLGFDFELVPSGFALPDIRLSPASRTVAPGASLSFSADVQGPGPFRYQWHLNDEVLPGATNAVLNVANAQGTNGGSYRVRISNLHGSVRSEEALLIVTVPTLPAPANQFGQRMSLAGGSGAVRGTNAPADKELSEPNHGGKFGGQSVWYTWQAPSDGIATFSLRGSCFDTLLGIYTGTNVSNLKKIVDDDDRGGGMTSLVQFNAKRSTNYAVAIDGVGHGGASGPFVLTWSLEATAQSIPVVTNSLVGRTVVRGSQVILEAGAEAATTYQWLFEGGAIPGATGPTLLLPGAEPANAGLYSIRLGNSFGRMVEMPRVGLHIGTLPDITVLCKGTDVASAYQEAPASFLFHPAGGMGSNSPPVFGVPLSGGGNSAIMWPDIEPNTEPIFCGQVGNGVCWIDVTNVDGLRLEIDTSPSVNPAALGQTVPTLLAAFDNNPGWFESKGDPQPINGHLLGCDTTSHLQGIPSRVCIPAPSALTSVVHVAVSKLCSTCAGQKCGVRITAGPAFVFKKLGEKLILRIATRGWTPDPIYRWSRNGRRLAVPSRPAMTNSAVQCADAGIYSVTVSNANTNQTFQVAIVLVEENTRLFYETVPAPGGDLDFIISGVARGALRLDYGTTLRGTCPIPDQWRPVLTNHDPNCLLLYTNRLIRQTPPLAPPAFSSYRFFTGRPTNIIDCPLPFIPPCPPPPPPPQ